MTKRLLKSLCIVVLCGLCTGCWDSTEIDQLAIVAASGVDSIQHEKGPPTVLGTIQIARASELGTTGGGAPSTSAGSTDAFVLEQAEGQDTLAAAEKIRQRLSRRLFLGHRRVIILGEDYAKRGVYDIVDEILRNPQSRLRTFVVVAYHDKAATLLALPYPLNRLPSDAIADIEERGSLPDVDAKQFIQRLTSHGDTFAMGIEEVNPIQAQSETASSTFSMTHLAIFHKDKLVGWLGDKEFQGFQWIYGRLKRDDTTVEIPGVPGDITARMLSIRTTRGVILQQGRPRIHISVNAQYDIAENGTPLNLNIPKNVSRVRSAITQELTSQMKMTMDELQHKFHADPFGFADQLDKHHPKAWKTLSSHWTEVYSHMPVDIETRVRVRNSGLTGPSIRSSKEAQSALSSEGGHD